MHEQHSMSPGWTLIEAYYIVCQQIGLVEVKNLTSGHRGVVDFKESGWFHKRVHHVEGYIESPE